MTGFRKFCSDHLTKQVGQCFRWPAGGFHPRYLDLDPPRVSNFRPPGSGFWWLKGKQKSNPLEDSGGGNDGISRA